MSPVEILVSDYNGQTQKPVKLVQIQGQLDESNVDEKSKVIYQLLDQSPEETNFIFDLMQLEYMNSKAIGYLTDWYNRVLQKNGQVLLTQAQDNILDILDTVGLTSIIEHHSSIEDAISAINN